jgi:hypothetical protein
MEELFLREKLADEASGIDKENLAEYAGRYIDPETGVLFIGLTRDDEELKQKVLNTFSNKERVQFFVAKHSKDVLDAKFEGFNEFLRNLDASQKSTFGLVSAGVSQKDSKVNVVVQPDTPTEQIELIERVIGDEYVSIEVGEPIEPKAARTESLAT